MSDPTAPGGNASDAGFDPGRRSGAAQQAALDPDNPWPGLEPFGEGDGDFFFGRQEERAELLRLVRRDVLTVLFGLSGLGKTSLLRAAVFPTLRGANGLPIYLRLDHDEQAAHPVWQVIQTVRREARLGGVQAPAAHEGDTLWEYFHRRDTEFSDEQKNIVTPVLVFDQFEELFTHGRRTPERIKRTADLLTQLADLVEARPPVSVKEHVDQAPAEAEVFAFGRTNFRVIFSLREEFLPELEDLKRRIPSTSNRMHLKQMSGDKALEVVLGPARLRHLVEEDVAREIVGFVAQEARGDQAPRAGEDGQLPLHELRVEPFLLSLFCRELNNKRLARHADQISSDLLRESKESIIKGFYERCIQDRAPQVRAFVEDDLLAGDHRTFVSLDNALRKPGVTDEDINTLVDRRLLRREERGTTHLIELTHDVLVGIVRDSRNARQQREALEREKQRRLEAEQREAARRRQLRRAVATAITLGCLLVGFVAATLLAMYANAREKRTRARSSFQDGLYRLQEGDTSSSVAYVAHALRLAPTSNAIGTGLFTHLLYEEWPVAILSHPDIVTYAVFAPDGRSVVTASVDGMARLWDAGTGKQIGAALEHEKTVNFAAFSPDGTLVVTASEDRTARLWDAHTGAPSRPLLQHEGAVRFADFSSDGTRVVTASEDGTARLWDAHTSKPIGAPLRHDGPVYSAAFSPDGTQVVTASADRTARVWDAQTSAVIKTLAGHEATVWFAAFSPDGSRVVTASEDRTARLWDANTGDAIGKPLGHGGKVWRAAFSPDGTRVVTASADRTARLWDSGTGAPATFMSAGSSTPTQVPRLEHGDAVEWAAFSPDGTRVVTASADHTAQLWDASSGVRIGPPLRHESAVWSATFAPDGLHVVTASKDDTARLWDTTPGAPIGVPLRHDGIVYSATFSPDGSYVVTGAGDGKIRFWKVRTGELIKESNFQEGPVYAAALSADGTLLVTAADSTVRLWNAHSREPAGDLPLEHGGGDAIRSVAISPDGTRIVTASEGGTAQLWDAHTRKSLARLLAAGDLGKKGLAHDGAIYSAAFSPDGTRVVTGSQDRTAHLWNASTGEPIGQPCQPLEHVGFVWAAQFSPDGDRVVTASSDKTVRLWDAKSCKQIAEPLRHEAAVLSARFSPDGELLVTGSADGTTRLWDARTGTPIGEPLRHADGVWSAAFSPDGTWVVTASKDKTARLWEVSAGPGIEADDLGTFAEAVAGRYLDENGVLTDMDISDRERRLADLRKHATAPKPNEPLTLDGLVYWFFADRAARAVSPGSSMTVPDLDATDSRRTIR